MTATATKAPAAAEAPKTPVDYKEAYEELSAQYKELLAQEDWSEQLALLNKLLPSEPWLDVLKPQTLKSDAEQEKAVKALEAPQVFAALAVLTPNGFRQELERQTSSEAVASLLDRLCHKAEQFTNEVNRLRRVESLAPEAEGVGGYASLTGGGTFGVEVGLVERKHNGDNTTVKRGGVGVFVRASELELPKPCKESLDCEAELAKLLASK